MLDTQQTHKTHVGHIWLTSMGTQQNLYYLYSSWCIIAEKIVPFYRHFFKYYRPTQKMHVLRFLANHKVYDEELFENFVRQISQSMASMSDHKAKEFVRELCFLQDPIQN